MTIALSVALYLAVGALIAMVAYRICNPAYMGGLAGSVAAAAFWPIFAIFTVTDFKSARRVVPVPQPDPFLEAAWREVEAIAPEDS